MPALKPLNLDIQRVKAAVKSHLKVAPDKVKKLCASNYIQAFDIQSSKGRYVLTAVAGHLKGRVGRQSWTYGACAKAKLPVPNVFIKDTRKKLLPAEFMITSYQPGEYLSEIFPSRPVHRKDLGRSAGLVLAKLHKVDVKGFGLLNDKGIGEKKSWDEIAFKEFEDDIAYIKKNKLLKPEEIQGISEMVEKRQDWLEWSRPVLIHGNIELDNLLAVGNDVTGLLGFGHAKGGDPAREFGRMYSNFYFNRERPFVEAVKVSYELSAGKRLDMRRVWLYCLMDRVKSFREDIEIDGTEPALAKKYHRTYIERVMRQVQSLD